MFSKFDRSSFIHLFLAVFASAFLLQFQLAWWIVVVIGFITGLVSFRKPWSNFLVVFTAVGLLWVLVPLYITLTQSPVLLSGIADLFGLPAGWLLFVVTALTGALPASIAALGASYLRPAG